MQASTLARSPSSTPFNPFARPVPVSQRNPERLVLSRAPSRRAHWRQRLRTDFRLAIVSLFGLCTVLGIVPLAAYRFHFGDWHTGAADLVLVAIIALMVVYAWLSGRTLLAARLVTVIVTLGFLGLVTFGSISVMWAFPLLAAGFLLADRVFASVGALATLLLTALVSGRFDSLVDLWSFLTTGMLVSVFGLIFATRTELQRRQLAEIASRDPLTRAGNRRALRIALDHAAGDCRRRGTPASVIVLDLDHFKSVNDLHGHEAGDQVLVSLVEIVSSRLRERDRIFRLGGEEFVVLLPATGASDAELVAGQLKRTIAGQLEGPGGPVTVSFGVAGLGALESVQDWLSRADEALYAAKRGGRDRIVAAEPPAA